MTALSAKDLLKADENFGFVHLLTGCKDANDDACYIYISLKPSTYENFLHVYNAKVKMNLHDYGTILHAGLGATPSDAVKREMKEKYGIDEHFMPELKNRLQKKPGNSCG